MATGNNMDTHKEGRQDVFYEYKQKVKMTFRCIHLVSTSTTVENSISNKICG